MLYTELIALIKAKSQTDESDFERATDRIKRALFSLKKEQLLLLVKEIGAIPENIDHSRGINEIEYWKSIITQIRQYTKEKAITELFSALKINEKISAISKYIKRLKTTSAHEHQ